MFLQFVYPKKFPINVSSVLLLSVLPTDHNRDKAGRNCKTDMILLSLCNSLTTNLPWAACNIGMQNILE